MKSLKFAHISDTHLVSGNPSPLLESLYRRGRAPVDNFISCLRELSTQSLDFVIHTGDAVHEGDADGYAKFRSLLNNFLPGIPVLVALGNHDHPEAFCNGFLNQSGNAEHFIVKKC